MKLSLFILVTLLLSACETAPPLPVHDWRGPDAAVTAIAQRSRKVQSASGTAALTLHRPDGAEVRVDAAFAAKPPEALRIRAWKFDRAVADWTFRTDGVWAWQPEGDGAPGAAPKPAGPWSANHAEFWPLLLGIIEPRPGDEIVGVRGESFTLRRRVDPVVVEIDIDGRTQTVTQCRINRANGGAVQRVSLHGYRVFDGALFPMTIIAEGEHGAFRLELAEVQINEPLAENALVPPKRALKLP